jgi:serine/threonine protein kinase
MNPSGISNSIRLLKEPIACPQCGSTSRVGRGLCLNCLLQTGLGVETGNNETLDGVLAEIEVRDADWRLGNYQILEEIGRGGMGVIYRARQRHSRRIVALKRILSYHADSQETLARFRREAEAVASLDHPNILPIYEVSESEDGLPFFSMKFAPGGSLLDAAPALRGEPRRSVALMAKVACAVQYAHVQGILHRDLKPGNVMLDGRGEPLVSDFGLAKWLDATSDVTRTLTIFGTPGYIAPEQARGPAAQLKPAADVYSLGAILFDLFTGRPPFLGEHALAVIQQAAEKPAAKLRTLAPSLDRDLETICARCLEREPQARYHSAGELAEDLERWLEGRPIVARPVSPAVRVWRWSRRNHKLAASLTGCLVLGAAVLTWQIQDRATAREHAAALHSVAVEPLLDLDTAKPDSRSSATIATVMQKEFSNHGPARVNSLGPGASSGSGENNPAATAERRERARAKLQGTKRVHDGKVRLALRLVSMEDGKILYRRIIESDNFDQAAATAARSVAADIYGILSIANPTPAESMEADPGWRDQATRELLAAGRAVKERRTLVDLDRAIELFEKVVKAQPRSALAHSYLAETRYGRAFLSDDASYLSAAEASARTAIGLNSKIAQTHKALSLVLFQQGRFRESLEEAYVSLEFADTDYGGLPNSVANNLRMLGQPANAAAWYRLGFDLDARPGRNEFSLADSLADLVDDENAARSYLRSAALFPEMPEGWMGLCRLALLQKDFTTARRISSENWKRYNDFVFSEEMAAEVEFFSRNFPEARKLYEELSTKDPSGGGEFYGAMSYQSALGRLVSESDQESGKRLLRETLRREMEALQLAPQHPEILYRVAAIESSLGQTREAITHLRAASDAGWIDYRSTELDPRFDAVRNIWEFQQIISAAAARVKQMRLAAIDQQAIKQSDNNH